MGASRAWMRTNHTSSTTPAICITIVIGSLQPLVSEFARP